MMLMQLIMVIFTSLLLLLHRPCPLQRGACQRQPRIPHWTQPAPGGANHGVDRRSAVRCLPNAAQPCSRLRFGKVIVFLFNVSPPLEDSRRMNLYPLRSLAAAVLLSSTPLLAAPLDAALDESQRLAVEAKASQARIEQLDDASREMLGEYRNALQQAEALKGYNQQLQELVVAQRQELAGYQEQLDGIERTQEAVTPQMRRMVEVLGEFIAADLPFLPDERSDRLAQLQDLLPRADVSLAEKYRRILEAYQVESDYGRTLEAWRGELPVDGGSRSVEFLRLGRVMLYFQTLDGHESGWWNPQKRSWVALDSSARRPLHQAIAIARQEQAPALLDLPVKTLAQEAKP